MEVNKIIFKFLEVAFAIMITLLIIYGAVRAGRTAFDFGYRIFAESPMEQTPGTDVVVTIESGMDAKEIGELLKKNKLIRDENLFFFQLNLSAYVDKIIPGTYTLNTSLTAKEMIILMSTEPETESTGES